MNQHYRVYKLNGADRIIKGKDIQAPSDESALRQARADEDCPVCEVWRGTEKVGKID